MVKFGSVSVPRFGVFVPTGGGLLQQRQQTWPQLRAVFPVVITSITVTWSVLGTTHSRHTGALRYRHLRSLAGTSRCLVRPVKRAMLLSRSGCFVCLSLSGISNYAESCGQNFMREIVLLALTVPSFHACEQIGNLIIMFRVLQSANPSSSSYSFIE